MKVNLFNQTSENVKDASKLIKTIFRKVKDKHTMQVIFVSLEQVHKLNRTYRNVDRPTAVLSFPKDEINEKSLGHIFICLDKAKIQAKDYEHSIEREIGFLSVHGYLHLKGFDHHSEKEEKEMIEAQEKILKKVKLERVKK